MLDNVDETSGYFEGEASAGEVDVEAAAPKLQVADGSAANMTPSAATIGAEAASAAVTTVAVEDMCDIIGSDHDAPFIFWEQDQIQVAYKPAGICVDDIVTTIQRQVPGWAHIHRLDTATSGCLVGSGSSHRRRKLCNHVKKRKCQKMYLALVEAVAPSDQFSCEDPLMHAKKGPQCAYTRFHRIVDIGTQSLLLCIPFTGRRRQIRHHLCSLGLSIVDDDLDADTEICNRIHLHAARYVFPEMPLDIVAPLSPWLHDIQKAIDMDLVAFITNFQLNQTAHELLMTTADD